MILMGSHTSWQYKYTDAVTSHHRTNGDYCRLFKKLLARANTLIQWEVQSVILNTITTPYMRNHGTYADQAGPWWTFLRVKSAYMHWSPIKCKNRLQLQPGPPLIQQKGESLLGVGSPPPPCIQWPTQIDAVRKLPDFYCMVISDFHLVQERNVTDSSFSFQKAFNVVVLFFFPLSTCVFHSFLWLFLLIFLKWYLADQSEWGLRGTYQMS